MGPPCKACARAWRVPSLDIMVVQERSRTGDTGAVLGDRYRLDAVAGRGGMSVVYRATDLRLQRTVAVKLLSDETDEGDAVRLEDELRLLAGFDHPGLVSVFDAVHEADGRLAVVLQWVDGQNLQERLADGPMPPSQVAAMGAELAELADALAYLGERDVVHRDVKPANVLIGRDRRARLADLGIARIADATRRTGTGTVIGTVRYLSPEQIRGEHVGPPSDIYSLGLVLLEALTGVPAFRGTASEIVAARLARDPVVPPALGATWRGVLTAMLRGGAVERPGADAVAAALRGLTAAASAPAPGAARAVATATAATERLDPANAGEAEPQDATTQAMTRPSPGDPPTPARRGVAAVRRGFVPVIVALLLVLGGGVIWRVGQGLTQVIAAQHEGPRAYHDAAITKHPAPEAPQPPQEKPDKDDKGPGNGNGNGNGNGGKKGDG